MKKGIGVLGVVIVLVMVAGLDAQTTTRATTRDDRQETRIAGAYEGVRVLSEESKLLKTRLKALEAAPRLAAAPRNVATPASAVDEDMREAFFVREGQDPEVAKAAARTRDRTAGREALLSVARKGREREVATLDALDKLSNAQARTDIVLKKGLGKKYSKIARDYGF